MSEPTLEWFKSYEIRTGGDGKVGVYMRDYNVRLATFNAGTVELQTRLQLLFERANKPVVLSGKKSRKADKRQNPGARSIRRHPKRTKINEAWGKGSGNW